MPNRNTPKSNAQRQADYRARQQQSSSGVRLNLFVDLATGLCLKRLAHCYGVTQRAILERVLLHAEAQTMDALAARNINPDYFYDFKVKLEFEAMTLRRNRPTLQMPDDAGAPDD